MIQSIQKHPQMNVFSTYVWLWVFFMWDIFFLFLVCYVFMQTEIGK